MRLYTGFDLQSSNSYLGIINENGKRSFSRKLANDPAVIIWTRPGTEDFLVPRSGKGSRLEPYTTSKA